MADDSINDELNSIFAATGEGEGNGEWARSKSGGKDTLTSSADGTWESSPPVGTKKRIWTKMPNVGDQGADPGVIAPPKAATEAD